MIHDGNSRLHPPNRTDLLPPLVYLVGSQYTRWHRQVAMKRSLLFDVSMLALILVAAIVSGIH